jgi:hypothetical protein
MTFVHPFMPDLSSKSLDDLVKEMNGIYDKMRGQRNAQLINQMQMVLQGYRDEYQKRMSKEMTRGDTRKSKTEKKDDE